MDEPAALGKGGAMIAPEVSIIIPCLNEERTIRACVQKCNAAFKRDAIDGEVIVIDNGSSDATSSAAAAENAAWCRIPFAGTVRP